MTAVLTVQDLHKAFGARVVLNDVSLAVDEQDRIALVGVNGSGKSTLLRIVARALGDLDTTDLDTPDSGVITKRPGATFTYVSQEPKLDPKLTIREHMMSAFADSAGEHAYEVEALADGLHLVDLSQTTGTLSGGERRRVALGHALLRAPDVLALDEPTNHLDAESIDWLEKRIRSLRGALLLVTHDRYFLDKVATRIVEIDRGHMYAYGQGYEEFLMKQSERLTNATERERIRKSFVRREIEWIRRGPKARTTKQQARIDRFDSAVDQGETNKDFIATDRSVKLQLPPGPRLGKTILELDHVGVDTDDATLVQELTLILKPGDRIGIVGPNGAGKTTLVRTLLGEIKPSRGKIVVGQNTRFAYLDQGRAELDDDRTVLEEVSEGSSSVDLPDGPVHVRTFLRMFLFDDRFADTPIGKLSGGERNRVQLTKLLRRGGNVLVLDEPTNDLDLITLGVLEEALMDFGGCALVVSHDRWFLDRVATGILAFEGGGKVQFYEGSYTDWLNRGGKVGKSSVEKKVVAAAKAETAKRQTHKLSYKDQRDLDGMEAAIAAAEAKSAEIEEKLYSGKASATESSALSADLSAAQKEVERLYIRWTELEELVASLSK